MKQFLDEHTGEKLGPGEIGNIMVKTPTMMKSYLDTSDAPADFFDSEGYGCLGDMGYYTGVRIIYSYNTIRFKQFLQQ